jgi:hypothetical protein
MKKKLATLLLGLMGAVLAFGQGTDDQRIKVPLCGDYDLDSASYIFVATTGQGDLVLSGPRTRAVKITTVGSSTTVSAATATQAPFQGIIAGATGGGGDFLYWNIAGLTTARVITAKADNDNVTVDTAIDLSANAQTFSWRRLTSGTTTADGWVPLAGFNTAAFAWLIKQSDATSIDVKVECEPLSSTEGPTGSQTQVYTKNVVAPYGCPSAAGSGACDSLIIGSPGMFDRCRLGFKINTDGSDAGANLEKITATFTGTR